MAQRILDAITGHHGDDHEVMESKKLKGVVLLMLKKNILGFNDIAATVLDGASELLGNVVSLQLISSANSDVNSKGKLGEPAYLEDWDSTVTPLTAGEAAFRVKFDWNEEEIGTPGAFIIRNNHHSEFYLKSLTVEDVPGEGRLHFVCNSWIYPAKHYKSDRIFFTNKTYLPHETPKPLLKYREEELVILRGDGEGQLHEWDRVYDYAYYNDLGDPDKGPSYARPVLGGSTEYPYPRRGRTGRAATKSDPHSESRLPLLLSLSIYVPRDERFSPTKMSDFLASGFTSVAQYAKHALGAIVDSSPGEFDSMEDLLKIYGGLDEQPTVGSLLDDLSGNIIEKLLKKIFQTVGNRLFQYPIPQDKSAWRTDEEFAREMLAGANPINISRLVEFPPKSKLDANLYGNQDSSITEENIKNNLDGYSVDEVIFHLFLVSHEKMISEQYGLNHFDSVNHQRLKAMLEQAIKNNKLFILDHHDVVMPYLRRINTTSTKTYASRTILFLKEDGCLKPIAIELSLPHPEGDNLGAISKVYTPSDEGVEGSLWQLAKAYVAVNDSGRHQLISHWLSTHGVIEPFIIAANRQLSVLHPIYKLLHPHFRDTMNINAFARIIVISAGGVLESTVFPSRYAMEMSSAAYKSWVFTEQAVPEDLKKRGMAVEDPNSPHGLRLLIQDYPYAVDGLEIWFAIKGWVKDYCSYYYKTDEMVQKDSELQSWWKELREEGHADIKNEPWWPKMQTVDELIESCTTIIWVAFTRLSQIEEKIIKLNQDKRLKNRANWGSLHIWKIGIPKFVPLTAIKAASEVWSDWNEEDIGSPGPFTIRNNYYSEFYLKSLTLEDALGEGQLHFVCNSWIYPVKNYKKHRVFFINRVTNRLLYTYA
ncbi:hypothetical protein Tsubulata_038929 [Turnera subulata]|uniref:Lipoxygenase n=1 Tax=Turnera subulata TaxID=218843 RepID=A0A9Q0F4Q8_9ROSI|nr:hypothetical protein Tsubulata_038929 [Turnera subulata]